MPDSVTIPDISGTVTIDALTGTVTMPAHVYAAALSGGSVSLTGYDIDFDITATIEADTGNITLTWQEFQPIRALIMPAEEGGFTLTGQDATLRFGYSIITAQGTISLSGQDAPLIHEALLDAGQGSDTLTWQPFTTSVTFEIATGPVNAGQGNNNYTMFGRNVSLVNGVTVTHMSIYTTTVQTVTGKIAQENSTSEFDIKKSEAWSHGGGGWQEFAFTTPYVVPGSGTFRIGAHASGAQGAVSGIARTYKLGDQSVGVVTGFTSDTAAGHAVEARGYY